MTISVRCGECGVSFRCTDDDVRVCFECLPHDPTCGSMVEGRLCGMTATRVAIVELTDPKTGALLGTVKLPLCRDHVTCEHDFRENGMGSMTCINCQEVR